MKTKPDIQPAFDPNDVTASLDFFKEELTYRDALYAGKTNGPASTKLRGDGAEFRNIRTYESTDDSKHIDWRASARQTDGQLQVRDFNRDITPKLYVVTDATQSRFESMPSVKDYYPERSVALSACMALFQLASRQNMPATLIAANDDEIIGPFRFGVGKNHLVRTAEMLAESMSENKHQERMLKATPKSEILRPRLADLISYAGERCANSLVAVVSDFRDADPEADELGWALPMEEIKSRRNSILTVTVTNPGDTVLPEHVDRFATEHGVIYIPTGKKGRAQREKYTDLSLLQAERIKENLDLVGALQIELSTDDPRWADSFREQLREQSSHR